MKKKENLSREQKDRQVRCEALATLILFAICFIWNVGFAYGLSGSGIRIGGMPLWWLLSVPGMFVVAVIGVVYLLKYVFVNFVLLKWVDLEDKEPLVYDYDNDLTIPPPESHPMSRSFQFVLDGGDGYWQAMLDLDDEKILWVSVNGHA